MRSSIKKKVKQHQDVLTIRSAVPLLEEERQQIIQIVSKNTDKNYDKIVSIIDPRLICGVSVKSDSIGFEYSGRRIINEMVDEIKQSKEISSMVDEISSQS
ncbi:ATP synthase delta (OSCP) subunit [Ignavigranum ruoffiae]|uniref:ATP synthase delta (OSCP) subunit n=1 Tax=Ignavigranum ruoffiae TaxID=89093 RepID=A0A1H9AM50_9LACT|nr:F0F1 ATP synthase subunit delta [Ignavigranum ruoffiae]SEP77645.1 ATP synthase delta (OSCP) subunit [Ignavigranum ruoffiae]